MTSTLHLAPYESGSSWGQGTDHAPLRLMGPRHLDELLCRVYRDPMQIPGIHIHGTLPIGPNWSAGTQQGWSQIPRNHFVIEGDSRDTSGLVLDPDAPWYQDRPDGSVLWFGPEAQNGGGWTVRNLTIDANQARLRDRVPKGGLRFHGNGVRVEHVRIRGLRGVEGLHEAFPISMINAPVGTWRGPDGGSIIRDLIIEDCAPRSFVSAIGIGYRDLGRPVAPTVVENVRYDLGAGNHFGLAANLYTTFRDISGRGTKYGLYQDETGDKSPCQVCGVQLLDSRLTVSYGAVEFHALRPGDHRLDVVVRNNDWDIDPEPGTDPAFLRLIDHGAGAEFADFVLADNRIRTSHPRMPLFSVSAKSVRNIGFRFNTLPRGATRHAVGGTPESAIHLLSNRGWDGQTVSSLPNF